MSPRMVSFRSSYCAWSIAPVLSKLCHLLNWSMHSVLSPTRLDGELVVEVDREDVDAVEPESVDTAECWGVLLFSLHFLKNGKSGGSSYEECFPTFNI